MNLPIGTNNSPDAVHAILTIPPETEDADSVMGQQRYHNKADMVVLVSNSTVTVRSGSFNDFTTSLPQSDWSKFLTLTNSFYNKRETKTVNAAFLGGIVPSGGGYYSGGVENFPRFLENWSGKTMTYNGSMVVMFYSKTATAPWGTSEVYSPPTRQWTFDLNFLDPARLPPGSPEVRTIIRGQWAMVAPNVVN